MARITKALKQAFNEMPPIPGTYIATPNYTAWREQFVPVGHDLLTGLESLNAEQLHDAYRKAVAGAASERLNPAMSHGDFHLALGMCIAILHKRGVYVTYTTG